MEALANERSESLIVTCRRKAGEHLKNRDQLRLQKQQQCEERLAGIYQQIPLLQELDQAVGQKNIAMIRAGVLRKDKAAQQKLQAEIEALMEQRHQLLAQHQLDESIYKPQWDCPLCEDRRLYRTGGVVQLLSKGTVGGAVFAQRYAAGHAELYL